jgi:hypothetical protein
MIYGRVEGLLHLLKVLDIENVFVRFCRSQSASEFILEELVQGYCA